MTPTVARVASGEHAPLADSLMSPAEVVSERAGRVLFMPGSGPVAHVRELPAGCICLWDADPGRDRWHRVATVPGCPACTQEGE